jgi:hypothetical protein
MTSNISKNLKNRDWLVEEFKNYGFASETFVFDSDDSLFFPMLTEDGYAVAIFATIDENWIKISTNELIKNTKQTNLSKFLEYNNKLKCSKLFIKGIETANPDVHYIDLGFEMFLDSYTQEYFFSLVDFLFLAIDKVAQYGANDGILKVSQDPKMPQKTLFIA